MKSFTYICVLALMAAGCDSNISPKTASDQQEKVRCPLMTQAAMADIKGRVKRRTEKECAAVLKDGEWRQQDSQSDYTHSYFYSPDGKLLNHLITSSYGILEKNEYSYNGDTTTMKFYRLEKLSFMTKSFWANDTLNISKVYAGDTLSFINYAYYSPDCYLTQQVAYYQKAGGWFVTAAQPLTRLPQGKKK